MNTIEAMEKVDIAIKRMSIKIEGVNEIEFADELTELVDVLQEAMESKLHLMQAVSKLLIENPRILD